VVWPRGRAPAAGLLGIDCQGYNPGMRKLLKRWYVWLGLVLVLGLAGSVTLIFVSPSRINQENFDRIQKGMSIEEVEEILWEDGSHWVIQTFGTWRAHHRWESGPNWIRVDYVNNGIVDDKELHLATVWETLQWYAKKGAEKVGIIKRVPDPFDEVVD
jgi:hypothetical protein